MSSSQFPHRSVLLEETCALFEGSDLKVFVDGTLGAGGHSERLLELHPEIERFIGIDRDPVAREIAGARLARFGSKVELVAGNAADLEQHLAALGVESLCGMMMDLGVSSMQLDQAEKGFSFSQEGPLDMRMDPTQELTAAHIVNEWSEEDLGRVFRDFGEERFWRRAARGVCEAREEGFLETTTALAQVLYRVLPRDKKKKINPLTLCFQGLRLAVNDELRVVEEVIPQAIKCLRPGGRLAMISFHSLEDRRVKRQFRDRASDKASTSGIGGVFLDKEPEVRVLTRKPVVPSEEEIAANGRSRSAKLRAIEKL